VFGFTAMKDLELEESIASLTEFLQLAFEPIPPRKPSCKNRRRTIKTKAGAP
jgi:hypothetical protein